MLVATGTPPNTSLGQIGGVYEFFENGIFTALPTYGVYATGGMVSFAPWNRGSHNRLYMCGGHSANAVLSETGMVSAFKIAKFTEEIVDSPSPVPGQIGVQSSGTGLTGEAVIYLRRSESATGRRSSLSGGLSKTLANNGLAFSNVPTSLIASNPLFDTVEVWVSLDGGLPRHLASRDAGASSFTVNEKILGEAEISGSIDFPTCKYAVMYHDRLVMSGNKEEPSKIFFSDIGDPETYTGLDISTRNGEKVIGLFVVRDTLVVQCENSHYSVQGFDENDIEMSVLEPFIGGLGHHTVALVDRIAIFPSKSGWYMCDGTSITPIGQKFSNAWAEEQHWVTFSGSSGRGGWVAHDSKNRIIRYKAPLGSKISPKLGLQTVNVPNSSIYWVLDYSGLVDGDGGIELMFDTAAGLAATEPTCAAMLTSSGGGVELYTGHSSGDIAIENIHGLNDIGHEIAHSWQSPQIEIASPGDDADCAAIVKLWLLYAADDIPLSWTLFAGNQYDWQSEKISGYLGGRSANESISAGAELLGDAYRVFKDRAFLNAEQASGSTVSLLVQKIASTPYWTGNAVHPYFTGAQTRVDSEVFPAPIMLIRGWGITFKSFGEASRGVRPYEA